MKNREIVLYILVVLLFCICGVQGYQIKKLKGDISYVSSRRMDTETQADKNSKRLRSDIDRLESNLRDIGSRVSNVEDKISDYGFRQMSLEELKQVQRKIAKQKSY